jgi:hypothetical protein
LRGIPYSFAAGDRIAGDPSGYILRGNLKYAKKQYRERKNTKNKFTGWGIA